MSCAQRFFALLEQRDDLRGPAGRLERETDFVFQMAAKSGWRRQDFGKLSPNWSDTMCWLTLLGSKRGRLRATVYRPVRKWCTSCKDIACLF